MGCGFRAEDDNEYVEGWFLFTGFLTALTPGCVVQAEEYQNYWMFLLEKPEIVTVNLFSPQFYTFQVLFL